MARTCTTKGNGITSSDGVRRHTHDVVVIGGGNAGIAVTARLCREDPTLDIALITPETMHTYRPLLSYVGAGLASMTRARRPQQHQVPPGCTWYRERASSLQVGSQSASEPSTSMIDDPTSVSHRVTTSSGCVLHAPDVIVCPGTVIDYDDVPGLDEACRSRHASTNYDPVVASTTWPMLRDLTSGNAVFVILDRDAPCPGVGLKPLFLAADHWRHRGRLDDITITLLLEGDHLTGLRAADRRLRHQANALGVEIEENVRIASIDPVRRVVHGHDHEGDGRRWAYDALHVVPPYRPHAFLADADVLGPAGKLVDVNPDTLHHARHRGVWSLGDAADLDTASSGGGLRRQVPVLCRNLVARRRGEALDARYDGYSVAPIPVDRHRLMLAEWDRRGVESRTLPMVSLSRPRRLTFVFDLHIQPLVYWHRLLRGK